MSNEPFTKVYHEAKCLEDFLRYCGAPNPRMAPFHISILTLTVIPEVRVTPKGLVDVKSLTIINPILEVR
jgi:Adenine deaminase